MGCMARKGNIMRFANWPTAALATLLSAGALAQAAGDSARAPTPGTAPVASDVAPPPAEERSSTGAVVLENSLVRSQRDQAFERSAAGNGLASVGRGATRAMMRARTEADLAQARQDEKRELRSRGSAGLIKQ